MGTMAAPFILLDFPRRPEHLTRLEALIGEVAAFLQLPSATSRDEAVLKRLKSNRLQGLVCLPEADAAEGERALRSVGMLGEASEVSGVGEQAGLLSGGAAKVAPPGTKRGALSYISSKFGVDGMRF